MLYNINVEIEERHYIRYGNLLDMEDFKGKPLTKNNPYHAKRNDLIPIGSVMFEDGTTLDVDLKSDKQCYFFEATLTLSNGAKTTHIIDYFPTESYGYEDHMALGKCAEFSMQTYQNINGNVVPNNCYTLSLIPVPDHKCAIYALEYMLFDEAHTALLFKGNKEDAPEMTKEWIAATLSDKLIEKYQGDMREIGKFLASMRFIGKKEYIQTDPDKVLNDIFENDAEYILDCKLKTMALIEEKTGWIDTKETIETRISSYRDDEDPSETDDITSDEKE